jgi:hypothetical protein
METVLRSGEDLAPNSHDVAAVAVIALAGGFERRTTPEMPGREDLEAVRGPVA